MLKRRRTHLITFENYLNLPNTVRKSCTFKVHKTRRYGSNGKNLKDLNLITVSPTYLAFLSSYKYLGYVVFQCHHFLIEKRENILIKILKEQLQKNQLTYYLARTIILFVGILTSINPYSEPNQSLSEVERCWSLSQLLLCSTWTFFQSIVGPHRDGQSPKGQFRLSS